ncbi:MAG: hypothetical protein ABL958_14290 [Bdellovibrionia bacterium]
MDLLNLKSITPTQYSLRDGIVATLIEQVRSVGKSRFLEAISLL